MGADHRPLVLLTGASGYIGGRLLKELEKAGWPVRCLARRPDFLRSKVAASTEVIKADCLDRSSLVAAMAGVQTAYYLVHSMGSSGKFEQEDREAAQNFADVAGWNADAKRDIIRNYDCEQTPSIYGVKSLTLLTSTTRSQKPAHEYASVQTALAIRHTLGGCQVSLDKPNLRSIWRRSTASIKT